MQSPGQCESQRGSPLISVKETAALLDISPVMVYRRFHAGQFPGRKVGRKIDLYRAFVDALIAEMGSHRSLDVDGFAAERIARHGMVAS